MSKNQKIILVFVSVILMFQCKNSESKKSSFMQYNTKEVLGTWKIIPSYDTKVFFDKDGRTFLIKENEKLEVFALEDSRGVRLQYKLEDDSPFAYFLFSEKTKEIWTGILDEKVVRIVKEGPLPESILE